MTVTNEVANAQAAAWNGPSGHAWVDEQLLLDRFYLPFQELLLEAVLAAAPEHVLDVGCGTGSTTLAYARGLGSSARVTGIDISEPMLAAAKSRAADAGVAATFVRA